MRRTLIAGNWKMNGDLVSNAGLISALRQGLQQAAPAAAGGQVPEIALCVPAPYLAQAQAALQGTAMALGGQDVSMHPSGAYTGEVAAAMLKDFDCRYVIVGHSERRSMHAESNRVVAAKVRAALGAGLTPILCVGETLEERDAQRTSAVVCEQLDAVLDTIAVEALALLVVAYEPVWAIGTGKTATPEMAQEVHALLRARLAGRSAEAAAAVPILYGGSMKPENARELLAMPDIDGGLIGGAALKAADFLAIIAAAN
jgi:triosephosphate isomerase